MRLNNRAREPFAAVIAKEASQSNTPSLRANSESSIIPVRKRYTSVPLATAWPACEIGSSPEMTRTKAPKQAHTASGQFLGRNKTAAIVPAAMDQTKTVLKWPQCGARGGVQRSHSCWHDCQHGTQECVRHKELSLFLS